MNPKLSDIARVTGTSVSTVSRVLAGAPTARRISEATCEKIREAAKELGYRPNLLARSLRTRRTNTVAVVLSDIANPWFGQLSSYIEQSLHRNGYSMIVCNSGEDEKLEQEYLRLLPQKGIDGLILVPVLSERQRVFGHIPHSLPLVALDRPIDGVAASVTTDQRQAAGVICEELERVGVKRVALVQGPNHVFTHQQRAKVIRERFEVTRVHEGPAQRETGRSSWNTLGDGEFDVVVCTNNFLGIGVAEAMRPGSERPIIACFDAMPMIDLLMMPVICCVQDTRQMADSAVDLLLRQISGGDAAGPILLPATKMCNAAFSRLEGRGCGSATED